MATAHARGIRDVIRPGIAGSAGAIRLLQIQIWLVFLFPTRLRIEHIGAPGNPAIMFGIGLFVLWSISVLAPSIPAPARCWPVRLLLVVFWLPVLLSYLLMHLHPVPGNITSVSDLFIVTLIAFSGVALYAAEATRTMDDLLRIIRTFVAAAAVMSLVAIMQARLSFDLTTYIAKIPFLETFGDPITLVTRGAWDRPAGTANHPIEFSVVAGLALAFLIYLTLYDKAWPRFARWTAVALIGLGIPVAVSRSGMLVAVAVIAVFFLGASRWARMRVLPALAATTVAVFLIFPGLIGTLGGLFTAGRSDGSIALRVEDYAYVESAMNSSLWLGRGPGSFVPEIRILDNQYLLTILEIGLIGVCALIVMLGAIWVLGRSGRRRFVDEGDRLLGQMIAAASLGILLAMLTYDGLSFNLFRVSIALLLGLAGRYWLLARAAECPIPAGTRTVSADPRDTKEWTAPPDGGQSRGLGAISGGDLPATS